MKVHGLWRGKCQSERNLMGGKEKKLPHLSSRAFVVCGGGANDETRFWPPYIRVHTANVLVENGDAFVHHAFMSRDIDYPWWYSIKVTYNKASE